MMRQKRAAILPIVISVALLGMTGCQRASESTNAAGTSNPESIATKALALDIAPVTASPKIPSVKNGTSLRGKNIRFIASGLSFPFSQDVLAGVKEGAAAAGATVTVSDSEGDPPKAASLVDQAAAQSVDVILLQGTPPKSVASSITGAKSHGIPVISVGSDAPGKVSKELADIGVFAYASATNDVGTRQANFVAADSSCHAGVLYLGSSSFGTSSSDVVDQFTKQFAQLCPDAKVAVQDAPLEAWSSLLQPQVNAFLQRNPETRYVVSLVDDMNLAIKPSITGLAGRNIRLVGSNAIVGALSGLQDKADPEAATVGTNLYQMGWAAVDQAMRAIAGEDAVADEQVPNRTFTRANIDTIDLAKKSGDWYGSFDFRTFYTRLWQG